MDGALATQVAVKPLTEADMARWDAFVLTLPAATFCHRAGWQRVIARAFGHRSHYAYAERNGEILKAANDSVQATLTAPQKTAWTKMIGEPFEMKFGGFGKKKN